MITFSANRCVDEVRTLLLSNVRIVIRRYGNSHWQEHHITRLIWP